MTVGAFVGDLVGAGVGVSVGAGVGASVGFVGEAVGNEEGWLVGDGVGVSVSTHVVEPIPEVFPAGPSPGLMINHALSQHAQDSIMASCSKNRRQVLAARERMLQLHTAVLTPVGH